MSVKPVNSDIKTNLGLKNAKNGVKPIIAVI